MKLADLEIAYQKAAIIHSDAGADYEKGNAAHDELIEVLKKMRAATDCGEASLQRLMASGDDRVVSWAALHLLPLSPKDAEIQLTRIALGPKSMLQFSAKMILKEWKQGSLRIAGDPLPLYKSQA